MIRALFGGTFDPFHAGHLALVKHLLNTGLAEGVLVVPAGRNPLRTDPTAAGSHRLAMARAALRDVAGAEVDGREIARAGPSYTVETLGELEAAYPNDRWRLVIGSDTLKGLARWRSVEIIVAHAEILVVPRADWTGGLPEELGDAARLIEGFHHGASATRLRRAIAAGEPTGEDLPGAVADYIRTHALYRAAG